MRRPAIKLAQRHIAPDIALASSQQIRELDITEQGQHQHRAPLQQDLSEQQRAETHRLLLGQQWDRLQTDPVCVHQPHLKAAMGSCAMARRHSPMRPGTRLPN